MSQRSKDEFDRTRYERSSHPTNLPIPLDPEYQTFVANMNAPVSAADALPNAEAMLEEIEKKQRELHGRRDFSRRDSIESLVCSRDET